MLELKNLEKEFQQNDRIVHAVKAVNLSIRQGTFVAIVGRSGSGKSTLLNLVAGLLRPTRGEIWLNGKNIIDLPDEEASFFRNTEIGYIMQGRSTLASLTVLDNVRLPYYLFLRDGDVTDYARELLKQMGIADLEGAFPSKLSGGELRRVSIARALINRPKLLLADEPTSDLDTENTLEIMKLFRTITDQGTTVVMVTHEPETLHFCDKVYRMEYGSLGEER